MLYTPPNLKHRLWDTWLFQTQAGFHLFYLQREPHEIGCSSIGHAFTQDWLHWETLPTVLKQGSGWDEGPLMTGMTFEHAGRYYMMYGAMVERIQRIGLAVSDDLIHWEKIGDNPILVPGGQWYETNPLEAINYETAWRDPYVFYHEPDQCFYALICARASGTETDLGGGCIALTKSVDLLNWDYLPPAYISPTMTCLEVPEYFHFNEQHFISFTTSYHFGTPYPTFDPYQASGTFYLVSDQMLEGYKEPSEANILNAALPHHPTNYVGRSIPDNQDKSRRLYYYHHVFSAPAGESIYGSLSSPKYLVADNDNQLNILYADDIMDSISKPIIEMENPLAQATQFKLLDAELPEGIFEATVHVPYSGLCFHMGILREDTFEGAAIWLAPGSPDQSSLYVMLGTIHLANDYAGYRPAFGHPVALRSLDTAHHAEDRYQLRAVYRAACVDVYVDDRLYLSHTYDPRSFTPSDGVGVFYAGKPKNEAVSSVKLRSFLD